MSVRDRMLALLEEELPDEFTVTVSPYAFDVRLDTESEGGDRRWASKVVTGRVSYDVMGLGTPDGAAGLGFNFHDDEQVAAEVLRHIGKKIGGTARWSEGDWVHNRGAPSVFGSKTMMRHFTTNKKKAPPK